MLVNLPTDLILRITDNLELTDVLSCKETCNTLLNIDYAQRVKNIDAFVDIITCSIQKMSCNAKLDNLQHQIKSGVVHVVIENDDKVGAIFDAMMEELSRLTQQYHISRSAFCKAPQLGCMHIHIMLMSHNGCRIEQLSASLYGLPTY